jgi:glycosyltransferase involved in cell wall biosynthesis
VYVGFASVGIIVRKALRPLAPLAVELRKALRPLESLAVGLRVRARRHAVRLRLRRRDVQVLCLIPEIVIGGSEKVLRDIVDGLATRGYRFHLLAARAERNAWCREFCRRFDNVFRLAAEFREAEESSQEEYYTRMKELVERLGIQLLLISNSPHGYSALPRFRSDFPHVPVVDLLHAERYAGASDDCLDKAPYIHRRVCISNKLRDHMKAKYEAAGIDGGLRERLTVIWNGHDFARFDPNRAPTGTFRRRHGVCGRAPIIAYIGRMSFEKRPSLFVDVAERLIARDPEAPTRFVMAGDGPQLQFVKKKIAAHGLCDRILLTGALDYEGVRQLLADATLVLIVSSIEGLPLVMVEAMSMNVPVLATDVGAVRDVLEHGRTGFLVHPERNVIEAFATLVSRLLNDEPLRQGVASRSREAVIGRFALEHMHERYDELFRLLLARPERQAPHAVAR